MKIRNIFISSAHNFFGHTGKPAGTEPMVEIQKAECVAGKGIVGDRFFGYKPDYRGQITFFEFGVYQELCKSLGIDDRPASAFRRNIITEHVDLNSLIGVEFAIDGVHFLGIEECRPCSWMDQAFVSGTETFLKNRGGLRAKILTSGLIHSTQR